MTYPAGQAGPTDSPVLHAVLALAPAIRAIGTEIEEARRIPTPIVQAMQSTGVFGMAMPRAWDGPELDPATQIRVVEALAMADRFAYLLITAGADRTGTAQISRRCTRGQAPTFPP